jgi:cellulose synthase/poly-beta-1,6-N-acetylglucosamine synthase-like glycosyltransferase
MDLLCEVVLASGSGKLVASLSPSRDTVLVLILFGLSLLATIALDLKLRQAINQVPQFSARSALSPFPTVAVIIPAYNEAENVEACLTAVLQSTTLPAERLQVWLVDDQSTDKTWAIAQTVARSRQDPRLNLLAGKPKPTGETWVGKNWACTQVAEQVTNDYLLFIDADVRLQAGAIELAVQQAQTEAIDLLSCGPTIECGCLAEWLVQPLMISLIIVSFDFAIVNDPNTEKAFAAGPFMLFRRSAYEQVGGHRAVAAEVVEDVELSRRIKQRGCRLVLLNGKELASVRMYRSASALWEGWTKNLYLAAQRNLLSILQMIGITLLICTVPWVGAIALLIKALFTQANLSEFSLWDGIAIALCCLTIALHYDMRRVARAATTLPTRYWWLAGLGGIAIAAIAIASVIKTETGWGWTWRGRSLKQP